MKVIQKKQIDYVAYVKNMWNFNISKKEKELLCEKRQLRHLRSMVLRLL